MKQGYALLATDLDTEGHWFGGEPYHKGAKCPVCKIPLLLIADLSCIPFRGIETGDLFYRYDRLPLYYCWRCCADGLSYRLLKRDAIEVFRSEGSPQGNDFPYEGFPEQFPRTTIRKVPIPYEIARLLAIAQEIDASWLSEGDRQLLAEGLRSLRHANFSLHDINRHQLGGLINCIQGHELIGCPNVKCKRHQKTGCLHKMKELANIQNDPQSGLPMVELLGEFRKPSNFNEWVQLVYWVCEECLSIVVSNRSD